MTMHRHFPKLGIVAAMLLAACMQTRNGEPRADRDADDTPGPDGTDPPGHNHGDRAFTSVPETQACDGTSVACGDSCVDVTVDAAHCGACGNSCVEGQSCGDGICDETRWIGTVAATSAATAEAVALDSAGNVVVVGWFSGKLALPELVPMPQSDGDADAYLAKLDPSGKLLWFREIAGAGGERVRGVAVSADDRIAITGSFDQSITIGSVTLDATGNEDGFVALLDEHGVPQWARQLSDAPEGGDQELTGVAFLAGGDLAVAGNYRGSATLDDTACSSDLDDEIFAARLDIASGDVVWARCPAEHGDQRINDIVATGDGLVVVGAFVGALTLDPQHHHEGIELGDAFVATFDQDGAVTSSRAWTGTGDDTATAVGFHRDTGTIVVAGSLQLELDLGDVVMGTHNLRDMYLALIHPDDGIVHARRYGVYGEHHPVDIEVTHDQIVVAGSFHGALDFDVGTMRADDADAFVVRLDVDGNAIWSHRYGGPGLQAAHGVAATPEGAVLLAGTSEQAGHAGAFLRALGL